MHKLTGPLAAAAQVSSVIAAIGFGLHNCAVRVCLAVQGLPVFHAQPDSFVGCCSSSELGDGSCDVWLVRQHNNNMLSSSRPACDLCRA